MGLEPYRSSKISASVVRRTRRNHIDQNQTSEELQYIGNWEQFSLTAGGIYYTESVDDERRTKLTGPAFQNPAANLWLVEENPRAVAENISQTLQFAQTGAADAGIVALSLALAPTARAAGRYWEIPADAYPRMEQGGIILKDSEAARAFRGFLISAEGRGVLKQFGFGVPGE